MQYSRAPIALCVGKKMRPKSAVAKLRLKELKHVFRTMLQFIFGVP